MLVRMTRAVVPQMRIQGRGRIINIGSVLGFLPMPFGALYSATKHAVEGYSESLDHELRTRGIRASVIEPAYTKTQFDANFMAPDSKLDEYRDIRALLDKVLKKIMTTADEPAVAADVVLEAAQAERPRLRYTAGGLAKRLDEAGGEADRASAQHGLIRQQRRYRRRTVRDEEPCDRAPDQHGAERDPHPQRHGTVVPQPAGGARELPGDDRDQRAGLALGGRH